MTGSTIKELEDIVAALREGDYDPYAQLYGFLKTGDTTCITRRNGARAKVKNIGKEVLAQYIASIAPDMKHQT